MDGKHTIGQMLLIVIHFFIYVIIYIEIKTLCVVSKYFTTSDDIPDFISSFYKILKGLHKCVLGCACIHLYVHEHVCVQVHAYRGQRLTSSVFSISLHVFFGDGISHSALNSQILQSQRSASPGARIADTCCYLQLLRVRWSSELYNEYFTNRSTSPTLLRTSLIPVTWTLSAGRGHGSINTWSMRTWVLIPSRNVKNRHFNAHLQSQYRGVINRRVSEVCQPASPINQWASGSVRDTVSK